MGRNYIERIVGLNSLENLDVLDLHDNKITVMEGLSNLSKLRVLNLSDNAISKL